jgi:hypothetical protein
MTEEEGLLNRKVITLHFINNNPQRASLVFIFLKCLNIRHCECIYTYKLHFPSYTIITFVMSYCEDVHTNEGTDIETSSLMKRNLKPYSHIINLKNSHKISMTD